MTVWSPITEPASVRFSSTLSDANTLRPSGEMATPDRTMASSGAPVMSWPKMETLPPAILRAPATAMTVVVLPAPLAPSNAVTSPGRTVRLTPLTARTGP